MTTLISTATIPKMDRRVFWKDISSRYFVKLDCQLLGDGFDAKLKHSNFGDLDLLDLEATPHSVQHLGADRNEREFFILSLMIRGQCEVRQDRRSCVVAPGELVLYDTARAYEVVLSQDFRMCSLRIPKETMRLYSSFPEHAVSRPITGCDAVGRIVGGLMLSMFSEYEHVSDSVKGVMAKPLLEMLAVGISSLADTPELTASTKLAQYHIERIKKLIDSSLATPELSVGWVADKLKMSPSSVHRAFSNSPISASEYIWNKRLEVCKVALSNPLLRDRSVSDIAYSWGFSSNSHFSRAFKRHTGLSPRAFRSSSLSNPISRPVALGLNSPCFLLGE